MYSGFLETSATELFTKIISNVNIMLFNYFRINFNFWRLTGPECGSADAYNTFLKIQTAISARQQVKVKPLHLKFSIYSSKHKRIIKTTIKNIRRRSLEHFFGKLLSKYPWRSYFLVIKVPCLQHILLNNIRRATLKFENYSLKKILF